MSPIFRTVSFFALLLKILRSSWMPCINESLAERRSPNLPPSLTAILSWAKYSAQALRSSLLVVKDFVLSSFPPLSLLTIASMPVAIASFTRYTAAEPTLPAKLRTCVFMLPSMLVYRSAVHLSSQVDGICSATFRWIFLIASSRASSVFALSNSLISAGSMVSALSRPSSWERSLTVASMNAILSGGVSSRISFIACKPWAVFVPSFCM